ncbi:mCG148061 [Mus musculus]|nr:mCG148061 [Mus musculus]
MNQTFMISFESYLSFSWSQAREASQLPCLAFKIPCKNERTKQNMEISGHCPGRDASSLFKE